MIQYLTTFSTVADYNTFLASEDCPYINVSHITGTNENKYYNNTDGPNQYLTLTVTASNNTVGCQCIVYPAPSQRGTVYYKLNNGDWTLVFSNSGENWMTLPNLSVNDVLQLKCDNIKNLAYWQFDGNDGSLRIKVSGHFNSLFTSDNFKYFVIPDSYVSDTIFLRGLLGYPDGQTPVVHDAEDLYLPTNLLPPSVFHHLFYNNSIITKVPDINALYLPAGACKGMFENCTALINMPAIAAKTIVAKGTFTTMFKGCTLLSNTTPLHIETITSPYDYNDSGGAFAGMFCNCESLTSAPSWSISWDYQVYSGKRHVSDNQPYGMYEETFYNCYNLTTCNWKTWVKMPPENSITDCLHNCFGGCTVLTKAIELSLGDKYEGELHMGSTYSNCENLTELIFSKVAGPINYEGDGPTSTGTIYVHPDSVYLDPNSEYYGQSPISGWTVESINNYPNS